MSIIKISSNKREKWHDMINLKRESKLNEQLKRKSRKSTIILIKIKASHLID
jgi:hypothetical protein